MHRLLSNRGYHKYQQIKLAEPTPDSKRMDLSKAPSKFPKVEKAIEKGKAYFKSSPFKNIVLGKMKEMPAMGSQAGIDNVIAANPNIKMPGDTPEVTGLTVGYRF